MALVPFDDRDGQIWMDGKLVPWRDARIHVCTHALHYGSAVFEGERAYDGQIFKLEEHTDRLFESARMLGMKIPYTPEQINKACRDTVKAQGWDDSYVRPIAWRGSGQMGVSAPKAGVHVAVAVWEWPSYFDPAQKLKGIRLQIARWKRPDPQTAPAKAKAVGLYMICTLAKEEAESRGYSDAMMFDWRGRVAEATGANIFFVKDNVLHTPVPDCFLDGITRRTVIDLARARGWDVVERPIMPDEMEGFEQCFLTGSAAEVTPVSEIGPYRFEVGAIAKQLMEDYGKLVRRKLVLPKGARTAELKSAANA
jgi:branched-chain amino acid aminotransferase